MSGASTTNKHLPANTQTVPAQPSILILTTTDVIVNYLFSDFIKRVRDTGKIYKPVGVKLRKLDRPRFSYEVRITFILY